jgi:DNA-binding response OmpR family regulator
MNRILVADDDPSVLDTIAYALGEDDFEIDTATDGEAALAAARSSEYDLLILNVMMPRLFGTDVLRELKDENETPIVLLTARDTQADRVDGLELGADDYVTKPFSPEELASRIRGILHRRERERRGASLVRRVGNLELDYEARTVRREGLPIALTQSEFRLLALLADHPGVGRQPPHDAGAPLAELVRR